MIYLALYRASLDSSVFQTQQAEKEYYGLLMDTLILTLVAWGLGVYTNLHATAEREVEVAFNELIELIELGKLHLHLLSHG